MCLRPKAELAQFDYLRMIFRNAADHWKFSRVKNPNISAEVPQNPSCFLGQETAK